MEIGIDENIKIKNIITKHDIASSKQKFQSDDSEGSDLNYQSSLSDEDQHNGGRVEFFKQEMARFFINYPQLINQDLFKPEHQEDLSSDEEEEVKLKLNRKQAIPEQNTTDNKEPSTSLEALAKRIATYRAQIDNTDIIDLLLQEKEPILKEIQIQMAHRKSEKNMLAPNQKQPQQKRHHEDNVYYSWRKRKQFQLKMKNESKQTKHLRSESAAFNKENLQFRSKSGQKFHRSVHKTDSTSKTNINDQVRSNNRMNSRLNTRMTTVMSRSQPKRTQHTNQSERDEFVNLDELKDSNPGDPLVNNWRHLVNFEPKTEIGRQLCEDIKKKNTPSDQLGIKKTIIDFLVNYKQIINNQVINKVTLSQKIQKLYTEDAKELLMFYPSKMSNFDSNSVSSTSLKDNSIDDKFIQLLKNITEGPIIKYWRQLQQSKI